MISTSKWIASALVVAACAVSPLACAQDNASDSRKEDDAFLLLRDSVRRDDAAKAEFYAARLANYPIPSYVDYYSLKARFDIASQAEIRAFLKKYDGSAIADRLRNDWLLELGRKRDWTTFDEQFPQFVLQDDTQVKCYGLLSRLSKGQNVATEARALLNYPPYYGDGCGTLIASLAQAGQFTQDDLWHQVRLAGESNATGPAKRTVVLLGGSEKKIGQAIDLPTLALAKGPGATRAERETFLVAVGRGARTSMKLAKLALEKASPRLTPQERAIGWANIALVSSYSLAPETAGYWARSAGAPLTNEQLQWKARFALRERDWKTVKATIAAMPPQLRKDVTWIYWNARAQAAEAGQNTPEALAAYQSIAGQGSYYAILAAEELGQQVTIPPPGAAPTPAEMEAIAANPGLRRALRFFSMRLRFEGTREWNWETRRLSERELIAAAEFAREQHVLDRMVYTSEKSRVQADYTHRYPVPHDDIMQPTTSTLGLDRAWVYGLIRQESRFIMDAQSSVGASGLMQVMPSTGRWVARKIGLTDFVQDMLTDVKTNILLGANYMNMVLGSMDGSQVLATAAYNAGPGRLRSWRTQLNKPMDSTIFIESIPFSETRSYVKNVMVNATFYAALFEGRPQSLKARLGGTVGPKGYTEQEQQEATFGAR